MTVVLKKRWILAVLFLCVVLYLLFLCSVSNVKEYVIKGTPIGNRTYSMRGKLVIYDQINIKDINERQTPSKSAFTNSLDEKERRVPSKSAQTNSVISKIKTLLIETTDEVKEQIVNTISSTMPPYRSTIPSPTTNLGASESNIESTIMHYYNTDSGSTSTENSNDFHRSKSPMDLQQGAMAVGQVTEEYRTTKPTRDSTLSYKQVTVDEVTKESTQPIPTRDPTLIEYCNPSSIIRKNNFAIDRTSVKCKPNIASEKSCKIAEKLYKHNEDLVSCGDSKIVKICEFVDELQRYVCSLTDCQKYDRDNIVVWVVNDQTGKLEKIELFTKLEQLQSGLTSIAKQTTQNGYNFLILECTDSNDIAEKSDNTDTIAQLLILPPKFTDTQLENEDTSKININLVLLDSAARSHFYRSLPKTLSTFEHINQNTKAEVLDFEFFQAVNGHTNQNLHALFTGKLFPVNVSEHEQNLVGFGEFYKRFASKGYTTLYHDSLCYDAIWGIRLNLGTTSKWDKFRELLKENHIHNTGLTFSSCKLLRMNGIESPFNGPSGPLCFNGRFMDAYHLQANYLYHKAASTLRTRLLTLNMLSVAHDSKGTRIQSIDREMTTFIQKMSTLPNTLTILFADHGNTYTYYSGAVIEGKMEQYHPSLFMVIPEGVQRLLGESIMQNLRENQFKLTTIIDIHKALVTIPQTVKSEGVFGKISGMRTCDDVELILPNFCVCKGWATPLQNDSLNLHLVEFAVGQLNNLIQDKTKVFPPICKTLIATTYYFVTERILGDQKVITLDFEVMAGDIVGIEREQFHIEMESNAIVLDKSKHLKLLNYDRLSPYGPYRVCADNNIDIKLCICDKKPSKLTRTDYIMNILEIKPPTSLVPTSNVDYKQILGDNKCLYLKKTSQLFANAKRKNLGINFITYTVANICSKTYNVVVAFPGMKKVLTTTNVPFHATVPPFGVKYIGTVFRTFKRGVSKAGFAKIDAKVVEKEQ